MFDLNGKVALVTGAAAGIGLEYVKELLKNGAKGVALVDINSANGENALNEITKTFGKDCAIFIKADVSDRTDFEGAFEATVKRFGQLDIVINNAGMINEFQWEKCVSVNLVGVITGSMLATEKYFPKYKSGPEAVILNTASITALESYETLPTYEATKCGVVGFTKAMGGELHHKTTKTRIIAVCPGVTTTAILQVTPQQVPEPYYSACKGDCRVLTHQMPEDVAKHAIGLLKSAPTGSIWLIKDAKCSRVEFPKY